MGVANSFVSGVLRSPLHRLISGSTDLIRYTGRRSGREIITPTQYVRRDDDVIILVGRPDEKTWWRNFGTDGDIDVLLHRRWVPMTARAVIGADDPETVGPLLDAYLTRFPRAARAIGDDTDGSPAERAVIVWCRPR
jgi:hypothetical protein